MSGWTWDKMIPADIYLALWNCNFPGWEKDDISESPHSYTINICHKEPTTSFELAGMLDDMVTGQFYYRDCPEDGIPFCVKGDKYTSIFVFQFEEDRRKLAAILERIGFMP